MPDEPIQNYKNHTRFHPPFHFFVAPVALGAVVAMLFRLNRRVDAGNIGLVLLSIAFLVAVFLIRVYSLKVQDRVIRLEETLRMQRVLPEPLRSRISELRVPQFVALRFAPDAELPGLVEQTLANAWKPKDIKQAIRTWRPDYFRI